MDEVVDAIEKYKGLVPLVYDIETMSLDEARPEDMPYAVYLKREADKVIACQKYKRCIYLVKYCKDMIKYHYPKYRQVSKGEFIDIKEIHWKKWLANWQNLANKFKD